MEASAPAQRSDREREAIERAGGWLARRAHSRREIQERLTRAGFDEIVVDSTLARLHELKLVDDLEFATEWVGQRSSGKGLGAERLRRELSAKGVDPELIETALAEVEHEDLERATELAARNLRKVIHFPLPKQAARLQSLLARRGFSSEVIEAAVRAVLPPEGWD